MVRGRIVVGDKVSVGDKTVVLQATVADHVNDGRGSTVAGAVTIRKGANVPTGAVVTAQENLRRVTSA